jgi:serine/threonine protein phosphatase 1
MMQKNFYMTLNVLLKNPFKKKPVARLPATLPNNHRLYCIGDIHGRLDLLSALHQKIEEDAEHYKGIKTIVYLGDYVDRGMDSKGTIDCLLEDRFPDFKKVFLLGNHEQLLLQFLLNNDPGIASNWLQYGGLMTLVSYGVEFRGIPTAKDINRIRKEFEEKLPATHLSFIQNLRFSYEAGDYFFVHAGIKPKVKLQNQQPEDLIWIRNEFLNSELFHEKIIVHGHSVSSKPEYLPNRIGIDTGAYYSGKLSCAVFEAESCKFL